MEFPHSYFEDEVREGVFVSGVMKRAWAAQLEVLVDIDKVCRKHNIPWFADCGTLLGAVRHKGFVPWDDDLDICMTRDNYLKFLAVAKAELPEGYEILNYQTEEEFESSEFLTRVINGRGINFDDAHLQKFHQFPYTVGVDIFPLDYLARDSEEEEARDDLVRRVCGVIYGIEDENNLRKEDELQIALIEELCRVKIDYKCSVKRQLYTLIERLFALYKKEEADELALMPYWIEDGNHRYPKSCFERSIMLPFENTEIPVPVLYDKVLQIEYGNYMKIVKAGGVHEYPVFRRQENYLEHVCGIKLPKYYFSKDDLKREKAFTRKNKIKELMKFIQLLEESHKKVKAVIQDRQYTVAMQLLESCQTGAIALGNAIEQLKGEGFRTVGLLETYCEQVYQIHEEMMQLGCADAEAIYQSLQEALKRVEDSMEKDIKERKEVVFFSFKSSAWDSFERVWREAAADPQCDVYVIPIPYYERNADSSFGAMHYEPEGYPDYVPLTSCEEYRVEQRLPDVIFIHNPYDECNQTTSVHPEFYSKHLKEYTEKLIYIPYFVLDEIPPEDERSLQNMEYYVTMPGVVHADTVIVQSEHMKQLYVEKLTEFAGEDTREIWEKKILGTGSRNIKAQKDVQKCPEEWQHIIQKKDGSRKKVILYYNGLSEFVQYKEQMVEKIREVFQIFSDNRDEVTVLWKLHPLIKVTLEQTEEELYRQYCLLEQEFCAQAFGVMARDETDEQIVEFCDAYYGDASSLAHLCRNTGKPVMLQNCMVRGM